MRNILTALLCLLATCSYSQLELKATQMETESQGNTIPKNCVINTGKVSVFCYPLETKDTIQFSGLMKSASNNDSNIKLKRTFNVNTDKDGNYFFKANTLSTYLKSGEFQNIDVYINNVYQGHLANTKAEWEIIGIQDKPSVFLKKGQNKIEFVSVPPFYPEVDAVEIAENESELITNNDCKNYLQKLDERQNVKSNSEKWEVSAQKKEIVGNPYITAYINVPVTYTYHRKITVTTAGKITIHTTPIAGSDFYDIDPVMYLYNIENPTRNSWTNDNHDGLYPKIEANVPAGEYYLVIRAKSNRYASLKNPTAGSINVYYDGAILNEKVPIAGYMINSPVYNREVLNYFTDRSDSYPQLFLLDGDKMYFNSNQYTYYPPAEYFWMDNSIKRVKHNANNSNWNILVTAVGAWNIYYGSCDVYGSVRNAPSKYFNKFPNLKSGDAVYMAEDDNKYNSAAWAGGITDKKIWISTPSHATPFIWLTWDSYFGNNPARYAGAETYQTGVYGDAKVVMYSNNGSEIGATHFAVRNMANNQLHGFAYESKIGDWGRITHTLGELEGDEYGKIYKEYRKEITSNQVHQDNRIDKIYTLEESICDGLTVEKAVTLDDQQARMLTKERSARNNTVNQVAMLFEKCRGKESSITDNISDNPYEYLKNDESKEFVSYCKNHLDECIPVLADKIFSEESDRDINSLYLLFCNITSDKYGYLMEEIKGEWKNNPYTEDGAYIFPSPEYFTKLYVKAIIDNKYKLTYSSPEKQKAVSDEPLCIGNAIAFSENPIRNNDVEIKLTIPSDTNVSLQITDVQNGKNINIINNNLCQKGVEIIHFDTSVLSKGMHICTLKMGDKKIVRKLMKK